MEMQQRPLAWQLNSQLKGTSSGAYSGLTGNIHIPMCILPKAQRNRRGRENPTLYLTVAEARDLAYKKAMQARRQRLRAEEAEQAILEAQKPRGPELKAPSFVLPRTYMVPMPSILPGRAISKQPAHEPTQQHTTRSQLVSANALIIKTGGTSNHEIPSPRLHRGARARSADFPVPILPTVIGASAINAAALPSLSAPSSARCTRNHAN